MPYCKEHVIYSMFVSLLPVLKNRFGNELPSITINCFRFSYEVLAWLKGGRFITIKQFKFCLRSLLKILPFCLKHSSKSPYLLSKFKSYSHQSHSIANNFFLFYHACDKIINGHSLNIAQQREL